MQRAINKQQKEKPAVEGWAGAVRVSDRELSKLIACPADLCTVSLDHKLAAGQDLAKMETRMGKIAFRKSCS